MRRGFLLSNGRPKPAGSTQPQDDSTSAQVPDNTWLLKLPAADKSWLSYKSDALGNWKEQGDLVLVTVPPEEGTPPHLVSSMFVWSKIKERILADIPGFPLPFSTPTPPAHTIATAPGAGLGMFAAMDLNIGDTILRERPLIVMPHVFPAREGLSIDALANDIFSFIFEGIPDPENQDLWMALTNVKGPEISEVRGRASTNAFHVGQLPGYAGVFAGLARDMSRVNHSCAPNAFVSWDLATFTFALRATTPIKNGQQIFCSYIHITLAPRQSRQEELQRKYRFACRCTICEPVTSNADFATDQSDARRRLILDIALRPETHNTVFAAWLASGAPAQMTLRSDSDAMDLWENHAIARATQLWTLMNMEGYIDRCGYEEVLILLCKAFAVLQDRAGVRKWATIAAQLSIAFYGTDRGWQAVADAPERTEWWGKDRARTMLGPVPGSRSFDLAIG